MASITLEEVRDLRNQLDDSYRGRHEDFVKLRKFWHGKYWDQAIGEGGGATISSIFRDLANRRADVGPDIKLIHNVLQEVCVKYQTFLAPLPQLRVFVDNPASETKRAQATLKERYLYGCWSENSMNKVNTRVGWYLPLMGDVFHGIYPDFDNSMPRVLLRSPEYAYPVPTADANADEEALIFAWKIKESVARRQFKNYTPAPPPKPTFLRRQEPADPDIWIYEYSDRDCFYRWVGDNQDVGVEHGLGFNLFEHMKFIDVPGEVWGHGAVEQAVGLVEMGNALHSLMFQSVIENVFPMLILEDPAKAPELLEKGPGAVIPLNAGGKAYYMSPPTPLAQMNFAQENERIIKQATSMPDVNFGNFKASIITGKAINELQGAGTGSVVEMVQGTGIGTGLVAWNEKALTFAQTLFKNDTIRLMGTRPGSMYDINPKSFAVTLKGRQIIGSNRNEVIFSPAMGAHEKLVMNLQALGAGMISKKYAREQQGIPDNEAMEEEIFGEQVEEAVLGFFLGQLQQEPTQQAADQAEQQATSYLQGKTLTPGQAAQPHPLLAAQTGGPQAVPPTGAPGAAAAAAQPALPPGGPTPSAGPGGPPQPGPGMAMPGNNPQTIPIDQAVQRFSTLQGVNGRVWLMGEIVARGQTTDLIEVGLTDGRDQQVILQQLQDWAGFIRFHHVRGQPSEPSVEVTPNTASTQGAHPVGPVAAALNPPVAAR